MMAIIKNFILFSRPHTVIGTTLSITALYVLALSYSGFEDWHFGVYFWSLVSCLGANIYIVGLNQITDVDIDRINKPYLPLASGAFSMRTGYWLITVSVMISLVIAFLMGRFLLLTVLLSLALGTAYSLPPIRLKRFYFWAAFCIIAVRGLIVNLLLFLHFNSSINGTEQISRTVWLLTATIFVYSIVIAWFKDMPDTEGDRRYRIRTLTLRLGTGRVFAVGNALMAVLFAVLIILPFQASLQVHVPFFSLAHFAFLFSLWRAGRRVDLRRRGSLFQYYQFIWKLFFLEYIAFAVAGVMG